MKEEDLVEGRDYVMDPRPADGNTDRMFPLARELVATSPDLIVSVTTGSTQAARAATSTIPIVMVAAHDPVEAGVVAGLSAPGRNVTGQSLMGGDLMPKQLELLAQVVPLRRIAYLGPDVPSPSPGYPSVTEVFERAMRDHASARGIEVRTLAWRQTADVDAMVAAAMAEPVDAFFLIESTAWFAGPSPSPLERIVEVAWRRRLPSFGALRGYAEAGVLMSYGDARTGPELWRGAAGFVSRILRGADAASLPIDRPTRFELVLNAKTAGAIGIALPPGLLQQAAAVLR